MRTAKEHAESQLAAGIEQASLDNAARTGLGNGQFEEQEEDLPAILEEFHSSSRSGQPVNENVPTPLRDRLHSLQQAKTSA